MERELKRYVCNLTANYWHTPEHTVRVYWRGLATSITHAQDQAGELAVRLHPDCDLIWWGKMPVHTYLINAGSGHISSFNP